MLVTGTRSIIRLAAGTYSVTGADGLNIATTATLAARASTITRTAGAGPIVTVRIGQTLKLIGGTLRGPNLDDGIQCNSGKVEAHEVTIRDMSESGIEGDSCELTVARSTIRGNLRGGINMVGNRKVALITNNFVYGNGQGTMSFVGAWFSCCPVGARWNSTRLSTTWPTSG